MPIAHLVLIAANLVAWSEITVQPSRGDRTLWAWQRSVAGLDRPSPRTLETLKRYDLEKRYRRDVDGALALLERTARNTPEPELVYALAELSWIEGQRLDRRRRSAALDRYVDAVAYAYDFLFDQDPRMVAGRNPSDPRFHLACDLYNGGLDRLIRAAKRGGPIEPGGTITLKIHGQQQTFRIALDPRSPWKADDIHELLLASDFEVTGLETRSHQFGLGVPLIAARRGGDTPGPGSDRFFPRELAFPLTAFLAPNSRLRDPAANVEAPRDCTLVLFDPVLTRTVGHEPATLPLEVDLTTPLAYMWSNTDLKRYSINGLLRPGRAADRTGLMLLRPYEPGKVPVVMVHGLISSPLAWIPMVNELYRDSRIQENYQFLLYMYPTGVAVPIAAAGLREALRDAEHTFNPGGRDPAFQQMVLLGHSMGGLLSHMMAVHSEDKLWYLNSDRRFQEILGPPEVLAELERYLFFDALPFVRRVVFLATPHRGSQMSRGIVGRVGSNLISEPDHISSLLSRLIKDNPDAFNRRKFRRMPTSIETLEPDAPVLQTLLRLEPGEEVVFHSIIGSLRPDGKANTTDGVVPYTSAHFEGAASELVVRSGHGVQKDPEAIQEVRRILLEHLNGGATVAAPPPALAH